MCEIIYVCCSIGTNLCLHVECRILHSSTPTINNRCCHKYFGGNNAVPTFKWSQYLFPRSLQTWSGFFFEIIGPLVCSFELKTKQIFRFPCHLIKQQSQFKKPKTINVTIQVIYYQKRICLKTFSVKMHVTIDNKKDMQIII